MAGDLNLKVAERSGEQIAERFGFTSLPVDPRAIAARTRILVDVRPLESCFGCLFKQGDHFAILYSTKLQSQGAVNFTIAHELGHYFLEGHCEALFADGTCFHSSSDAPFKSADPREREADSFAVGLLMPEALFVDAIDRHEGGLKTIRSLSEQCQTSLTATAIRYANLARTPVAIIFSAGEKVDFCFMSECLKEFPGLRWMRKGTPIPKGTVTSDLITRIDGATGLNEVGWSDFSTWFDGGPSTECHEEVMLFPEFGTSLTVLWTDESLDRDDESDYVDDDD